ncbi:hypothetical protein JA1_000165 [Spathaspora sp. JA1]|nr:hypothetical protein JA1_000165 [Spathaspora sp. JA1]
MTSKYTLDKGIPRLIYTSDGTNRSTTTTSGNTGGVYQINTFIDWARETTHTYTSISNKWTTLIISALALGYTTAFIQFMSVNLTDIKSGICYNKTNVWSLLNPYSTCPSADWHSWSKILFNSDNVWFVNFVIYLMFAVGVGLIAGTFDNTIKQSGIPEIKLIINGFQLNGDYLGISTLVFKILGLILVVSSGLWLGKEGPLVHISCCIFNIIFQIMFRNSSNEAIRREFLMAGVAAGIAVAFDSPIGGVLFVFESMSSYFPPMKIMWNSFVSATIAVVVLTGFKGNNFQEQDLFQVNFGNFSWLFMEIFPFLVLGLLGGVYGYGFTQLNSYFETMRQEIRTRLCDLFKMRSNYGKYLEILVIVVITTLLNFPFPMARLSLDTYLKLLFQECTETDTTPICQASTATMIIKLIYITTQGFFLSAYSYGLELPGGILMPTLVIGASTGRILGIIALAIQSKFAGESMATCTAKSCLISPSSYAVIGAASFMTGITKLTMCVVVIMFEMTGAVTYVLPIMFAVMTSKFMNDWLCVSNIYDVELSHFNRSANVSTNTSTTTDAVNLGKGTGLVSFNTLTTTEKAKLPDVSVESVMIPLNRMKCLYVHPEIEYTANSLYNLTKDNHQGYPVILSQEDPVYLGYVTKLELLTSLNELPVTNTIQIDIPQYESHGSITKLRLYPQQQMIITNPETSLIQIIHEFEKLYLNYMTIVQDGKLVGFIDRFMINKLLEGEVVHVESWEGDEFFGGVELSDLRVNRKSIELIT